MPNTLIHQFPKEKRVAATDSGILSVSEMFCDTLQGEGIHTGVPATFIRLQRCTLACVWCDTLAVWKKGNPYSIKELFKLFEDAGMIEKFKNGQHIVLTGGSPILQQAGLLEFVQRFKAEYGFNPHYEVENESTRPIDPTFARYISTWNNSPKLANSAMKKAIRYKPEVLKQLSALPNSWFKFVVSNDEEWNEIKEDFLDTGLIKHEQIILMPCGENQAELALTREMAADLAIKYNTRYSDRAHVTIWDEKTGV